MFTDLDTFLNSTEVVTHSEPEDLPLSLDAVNGIDPRLLNTSYSSTLDFASCPRKYQLRKLSSVETKESQRDYMKQLTFQFGKSLGDMVQETLKGELSKEQILFKVLTEWKCGLYEENPRQQKSIFHLVEAANLLWSLTDNAYFDDYEVAVLADGKPAIELSFKINMPYGVVYRGFVDAILKNKVTGEYLVLEIKSSSGKYLNQDNYINSEQAIGYSIILDKIVGAKTDFTVYYLVYLTRMRRWEDLKFPKTYTQRSLWIRDRLWDAQVLNNLITEEGSLGTWPTRSQGCSYFGSTCQYMNLCHQNTEIITKPINQRTIDFYKNEVVDFEFDLEDII